MIEHSFNWKNKKVFVTGAGGFIGSHLVEWLVERGAYVKALVRYNSRGTVGWLEEIEVRSVENLEIVQGDLRDLDFILGSIKGSEYVFHLGAMISIPYSYVSPREATSTNVEGTRNVLDACKFWQVKKMIHTSTSEVYGTAQYVPIDEKHPLVGQSPYSASKIGADHLVESYHRSFDVPAVIVRPFNTYGPRQSLRAVIPTVICQMLVQKEVRLGNTASKRDFTFVADTVKGMINAAELDTAIGKSINLGSGTEISVGELVKLLREIIGYDKPLMFEQGRIRPEKSEVDRLLSDNRLAQKVLNWTPRISLREGLTETVKWFQKQPENFMARSSKYFK